jgi:hypothetical protein
MMPGTNRLSDRVCRSCRGSGERPLPHGEDGRKIEALMIDFVQRARQNIPDCTGVTTRQGFSESKGACVDEPNGLVSSPENADAKNTGVSPSRQRPLFRLHETPQGSRPARISQSDSRLQNQPLSFTARRLAQSWQSGYQRDGDERREGHRPQPRAGHAAVLDWARRSALRQPAGSPCRRCERPH